MGKVLEAARLLPFKTEAFALEIEGLEGWHGAQTEDMRRLAVWLVVYEAMTSMCELDKLFGNETIASCSISFV